MEIPNIGEEVALFAFLDGLSGWAKTELERHGVQDLASVVATAESLNEYKRDSERLIKGTRQEEWWKRKMWGRPGQVFQEG